MVKIFEIFFDVAQVGVILALFLLNNFLGAFFIILFWIYYHRKTIFNLNFDARKKSKEDIFNKKWEEYVEDYLKLNDWVNAHEKLKFNGSDSTNTVNALLSIRSNQIQLFAMFFGMMAIFLAFVAIVYAAANLYTSEQSFQRNIILALGAFFTLCIFWTLYRFIKKV